jgi:Xaa-Pro aminopeptidase
MFHIAEVTDDAARVTQAAIDAQQPAIAAIRPGVQAQKVAAAADEVYAERGYQTGIAPVGRSVLPIWKLPNSRPGMKRSCDRG